MSIPLELTLFKSWCVWKAEEREGKTTKIPYNAHNGHLLSVNNPSHLADYEMAQAAANGGNYDGVGFVCTDNDPYTFIDLDPTDDQEAIATQRRIFEAFQTYAEISPSGRGLHLICRGKVPMGRRRGKVEIYSSARYMTVTGNTYRDLPIIDCQAMLNILYDEMGKGAALTYYSGSMTEPAPDDEIIRRAVDAINGEKAKSLLDGRWNDLGYRSQSEADFALMDILAYYTQNRSQLSRLFRNSALGHRDKANRDDYISWMIHKAFDRMLPLIDFDILRQRIEEHLATNGRAGNGSSVVRHATDALPSPLPALGAIGGQRQGNYHATLMPTPPIDNQPLQVAATTASEVIAQAPAWPQGLLGDVAAFIHAAAPRPVREIALAGAIGLLSGICGRAWNVSGTGLNTYTLLLASTGAGKEAMSNGIDRLMASIRNSVPAADAFVGPAVISSPEALIKHFDKHSKCFVSLIGEFGLYLKTLLAPQANASQIGLRRMFLDLYNKSGRASVLRPTIYSDRTKNTDPVNSPSFSILAETTPETFYDEIDDAMISQGLLPRFLLLEYRGLRPPPNNAHNTVVPSADLVARFGSLCAFALQCSQKGEVIDVGLNDDADKLSKKFNEYCDQQINEAQNEVIRHLWNRAHVKVLKLAALLAVGIDPWHPVITANNFNWAAELIYEDVSKLMPKMQSGEVGKHNEETKQIEDMRRAISYFAVQTFDKFSAYRVNLSLHKDKVIPLSYLQQKTNSLSSYRNDRMGASVAFKRSLQYFIDNGIISEVSKSQMRIKYKKECRAFVIVEFSDL